MPGGGYSLAELHSAVLSEADWAPTQSTPFIAELDRFLWQAARRLVTLTPSLLYATERMWIQPMAQNSSVATDRLRTVSGDRMVLERPTTDAGRTAWDFTGLWGSWNLHVTDSDNVVRRYRAHEFWEDAETSTERVSLDKPMAEPTTGMTWKLFQDPWPLPPDVVNIVDVRLYNVSTGGGWRTLRGVTEREFEDYQRGAMLGQGDAPFLWCRGPSRRLQPPRTAPTVANSGSWSAGGDDTGVWEYCYTIAWGERDPDAVDPHGNPDPSWESPPSPVSSQITATAGGGGAISITWPAPDYIAHYAGLPSASSARTNRSGYYVILYARRVSDTETPPVDELAGFCRLAIAEVTPGSFSHDGTQQVVYERPLTVQHACPTIRLWPIPRQRHELDLRVVKAPSPLNVAADVLPIPHEAYEIVVLDARRRLAKKLKEHDVAAYIESTEIPRAVAAALSTCEVDTSQTLIMGRCNALNDDYRGLSSDEAEFLLYGPRS